MILEGLLTTLDHVGQPHLAAMGAEVETEDFSHFRLKPYCTSKTYQNLLGNAEGVFHTTDDVLLIASAALGHAAMPALKPATIRGYYLDNACRAFDFRVISQAPDGERAIFQCEVIHRRELRPFFGFNRAKHAVIEAAILATRFHLLQAKHIDEELRRLRVLVDKTAGSAEREAMALIEASWAARQ